MKETGDNDIMERVKTGHHDDLSYSTIAISPSLMGFYRYDTRSLNKSADLVQNVFYRIPKYRAQFKRWSVQKHGCFHIARNVHRDSYKRKKLR